MELVELPFDSLSLKCSPYLLRFDFVPANYNLKKDLQKISSQSSASWAFPNHPAYEYLFGQPSSPTHEVLFFGAFSPPNPPNQDQATALKHQRENSLTAVIGPPGNGKTTLLLHEIALSVVERGLSVSIRWYRSKQSDVCN